MCVCVGGGGGGVRLGEVHVLGGAHRGGGGGGGCTSGEGYKHDQPIANGPYATNNAHLKGTWAENTKIE